VQRLDPPLVRAVLLDLPGLLFFSTYTLLVLFWAEIYHQARSLPTSTLRPIFIAANIVVYALQVRPRRARMQLLLYGRMLAQLFTADKCSCTLIITAAVSCLAED
jgi:hypothetical protein